MPKGESNKLVLKIPNGEVYDEHGIRLGITNWAKAAPVPPHGRLIDADALLSLLDKCMFPSDMVTTSAVRMATNWIKDAPTIIEAEPCNDLAKPNNASNTLDALTNADRIRAMTDMELAKELSRIHGTCDWCPMHDDCDGENCDGQLLDWMKQEAE